jgi:hypothetical protein
VVRGRARREAVFTKDCMANATIAGQGSLIRGSIHQEKTRGNKDGLDCARLLASGEFAKGAEGATVQGGARCWLAIL